ncbi:hypothetical protein N1851_012175 [Merluccius polli]|uniref:Uncharacterized protein n=1 Tax=Merluccius polli TaxID=89951 RepID=A0AA47MXJ3_MERPO|nr:hypothetical protein N1851_012175 [Merluccius polli]
MGCVDERIQWARGVRPAAQRRTWRPSKKCVGTGLLAVVCQQYTQPGYRISDKSMAELWLISFIIVLNLPQTFSIMPESYLDELVTELVAGNDMLGSESVRAALHARGLRVQQRRVRESMLRTNPGAAALRYLLQRPERRTYQVQGPNFLWHIDGRQPQADKVFTFSKLSYYIRYLNLQYFMSVAAMSFTLSIFL